jgi:hypothetical protein
MRKVLHAVTTQGKEGARFTSKRLCHYMFGCYGLKFTWLLALFRTRKCKTDKMKKKHRNKIEKKVKNYRHLKHKN